MWPSLKCAEWLEANVGDDDSIGAESYLGVSLVETWLEQAIAFELRQLQDYGDDNTCTGVLESTVVEKCW
jgi:hypothetical protein